MNAFQQILGSLGHVAQAIGQQARIAAGVVSAVFTNQVMPARQVVIYLVAIAVLVVFAPKIIRKLTK
jgi:hypothetical protein